MTWWGPNYPGFTINHQWTHGPPVFVRFAFAFSYFGAIKINRRIHLFSEYVVKILQV